MQTDTTIRGAYRLFIVVGEAALIYVAAWWGVVFALMPAVFKTGRAPFAGGALVTVVIVLLTLAECGWMFRKLEPHYSRREARAAAIAFGLCTPLFWLLASALGQLFGGYTGLLLGARFALFGAFVGAVVATLIVGFAASALALLITHRIQKSEQRQEIAS